MRVKHVSILASIATAGLLLAGCSSLSGTVSTTAATGGVNSASTKVTTSAAAKKAGVGDPIVLNGAKTGDQITVTLAKVIDPDTATDQFSSPQAGDRFVSVQFQIKNTGGNSYNDDPQIDVTVKDAKGQTYQPDITVSQVASGASMPSSVNLAVGDTALGVITFDVPTGVKVAQVLYALNGGMFGNSAEWTVS